MRFVALALLSGALCAAPAGAAVRVQRGVEYGRGQVGAPRAGSVPLLLDLYRPAGPATQPRPVVVVIHGGGFVKPGRADPRIVRVARGLAARGIVAASIGYRLSASRPRPSRRVRPLLAGLSGPLPGDLAGPHAIVSAIDDTLTAIDYLRAHATALGIDADRLGLVGSSAGAITADHIAYVLDDYGIERPEIRFVGDLWGGILIRSPGGDHNGAVQLESGEAPLFAVHGSADTILPVRLDDALVARARSQNVDTEYHRVRGGRHGYEGAQFFTRPVAGTQTAFDRLLAFAAARLR